MLLEDRLIKHGDRIVHKRVHDHTAAIKQAKDLRDGGHVSPVQMSDSYLAARIPMPIITDILRKAGVKWDDPAASQVIIAAINSGEYDKFRIWQGNI